MKMKMRSFLCILLTLIMLFSIIPVMTVPVHAAQTYISEVAVAGDSDPGRAKQALTEQGFIVVDKDLNAGCGKNTDYIYLGYKTTEDPALAIKDLRLQLDWENRGEHWHDGRYYKRVNAYGSDDFISNFGNLNNRAGGRCVFLFYSMDESWNTYALTNVRFNDDSSGATSGIDLNKGASGEYIYLHCDWGKYEDVPDKKYISDLMVSGGQNDAETLNLLRREGYKVIHYDLNKGARGDFIYLGYKTTDNYDEAIKDVVFLLGDANKKTSVKYDDVTYDLCKRTGSNDFINSYGDLNHNTKTDGAKIFLFYTKTELSDGGAISSISFNGTYTGSVSMMDLNKGARGDYTYMHAVVKDAQGNDITSSIISYISDIKLVGCNKKDDARNTLFNEGYCIIDEDLNDGAGGSYIYLGFKRTRRYEKAIKDIIILHDFLRWDNPNSAEIGGIPYNLCPVGGSENFCNAKGDINHEAGGNYLYIFYTMVDANIPGSAITDLYVNDQADGAVSGKDLNESAGGDYIYLHAVRTAGRTIDLSYISGEDWMGRINDDILLTDLSIPGVHDAASCYIGPFDDPFAKTQKYPIRTEGKETTDLLSLGVRYFDMRIKSEDDERLYLGHGVEDARYYAKDGNGYSREYLYLDTAWGWIKKFLKDHPTETVILDISQEDGIIETSDMSYDFFRNEAIGNDPIIWSGDHIPTLGEVRGKVVILSQLKRRWQKDYTANTYTACAVTGSSINLFHMDKKAEIDGQDESRKRNFQYLYQTKQSEFDGKAVTGFYVDGNVDGTRTNAEKALNGVFLNNYYKYPQYLHLQREAPVAGEIQTYISDIVVLQNSNDEYAEQLRTLGYEVTALQIEYIEVITHFQEDEFVFYENETIYLAYKTTTDYADAVKNLVIMSGEEYKNMDTVSFGGTEGGYWALDVWYGAGDESPASIQVRDGGRKYEHWAENYYEKVSYPDKWNRVFNSLMREIDWLYIERDKDGNVINSEKMKSETVQMVHDRLKKQGNASLITIYSSANTPGSWYTGAVFTWDKPYEYADYVNPKIKELITNHKPDLYTGILAMDFVDEELAKLVFGTNLNRYRMMGPVFGNTWDCTLSFETNGGTELAPMGVHWDRPLEAIPTPEKEGFDFGGWYLDRELTNEFDPANGIEDDTTIYAKWLGEVYRVDFVDEIGPKQETQKIKAGETAMLPEIIEPEDAIFLGWFSDPELTQAYDFSSPITSDIILYAKWETDVFTITFDTDGGSDVPIMKLAWDAPVSAPEVPVKQGYVFLGWTQTLPEKMPAENITVSAVWSSNVSYAPSTTSIPITNSYTINYNNNGGTGIIASQSVSGPIKLHENTFIREGYTFIEWNTKADGTGKAYVDKADITPVENITLYAQWKETEPILEPTPEPKPIIEDKVTKTEKTQGKIDINSEFKVVQSGNKVVVEWGAVEDADKYVVYAAYCSSGAYKKIKTLEGDKLTLSFKKLNGKKIDFTKEFKVYVAAYRTVNGEDQLIASTIKAHVVGDKAKKRTNAKSISVEKSKYSVKKGKTVTISATTTLVDPGKKQLSSKHAPEFRYLSTDKSVATVDKNGVVTGKKKGTCYIWVYSRNGLGVKVKVTVK